MIRPEITETNAAMVLRITNELAEINVSPTQVVNILLKSIDENIQPAQQVAIVRSYIKYSILTHKKP